MPQDNVTPMLLSVQDACKFAGVGKTTLFGMLKRGEIEGRKAGARTLVVTESLRRWADGLPPARPDTQDAA